MASCRNIVAFAHGFCAAQATLRASLTTSSEDWTDDVRREFLDALRLRERNMNGNVTIVVRWLVEHGERMTGQDIAKMLSLHWRSVHRLRWTEALSYLRGYLEGRGVWEMNVARVADLCDILERVEDTLPKRMQQLFFELLHFTETIRAKQASSVPATTPSEGEGKTNSASVPPAPSAVPTDTLDLSGLRDALACDNVDAFPALSFPIAASSGATPDAEHAIQKERAAGPTPDREEKAVDGAIV